MTLRTKTCLAALFASSSLFGLAGASFADDATMVQDIVVTAPRQEVEARAKQEKAPVLIAVQAAETIAKYPDYNAAEAMARMPGVSLSTDTGEGRFVNIRGVDANLNGATYGGIVLLNTFPAGTAASGGGRAVEFDTIPTGAIDGIVLYKTLSPDREAEGLGGQIELTPRSAKTISHPFFEGELGWGYESLHDHTGPATASAAMGARFGLDDHGGLIVEGDGREQPVRAGFFSNPTPFSFVITASRKDDRRGIDDIEPSYANDGATAVDNVLGEVDFRRYDYHRRRFGYGGEFDFKPNDNHAWYARLDVAGYIEAVHKNHFYAMLDGAPTAVAGAAAGTYVDTFQARIFEANAEETHRNTIATIGGEDHFDKVDVDYHAAYSRATYVQNAYREARWNGPSGLYAVYNANAPNDMTFRFFTDAGLTTPWNSTTTSQYANPRLRQYYENDVDEEYSYAANLKYRTDLFGGDGQIKVGLSARLRDKVVNDFGAQTKPTVNLGTLVSSAAGAGNDYYDGRYVNGPYLYAGALAGLYTTPLSPSFGRDFNDTENVYAAYGMYTGTFDRLTVLAGLRIEATDASYGNILEATDASGNVTDTPVTHKKSYANLFPTVQLRYEIRPNLLARATWSTGIARPGFSQAGGFAGVDFTTSPRPQYTAGNPDLKPTTGNNFDLSLEYYTGQGGVAQIGFFDKEFSNYIFKHTKIMVSDPIFQGQLGDVSSFSNEDAWARGFEFALHQQFVFLPGLWRGLGVEANGTWVDSRFLEYDASVAGAGVNEYGQLPGTSHVTWNLALFYELGGLNLRLSSAYVGKSLFGLNGDKSLDTIQATKVNYDFTSSYAFTRNLTAYFNVKNLSNTPLRYNEGSNARVIQREIYGQTYEAGLRFRY